MNKRGNRLYFQRTTKGIPEETVGTTASASTSASTSASASASITACPDFQQLAKDRGLLHAVIQLALDAGDSFTCTNSIAEIMHYHAQSIGWKSRREYPAPTPGRKGRIDLWISDGRDAVAIEIDDREIKDKSVKKLRTLMAHRLCIVARNEGEIYEVPDGIDCILSIRGEKIMYRE